MNDTEKARAEARTEQALAESAFHDPRDAYRDRLRNLRKLSPSAYSAAVQYYEETLLPTLLDEATDPLVAWIEYGRRLGQLTSAGRVVSIDATGRAEDYQSLNDPPVLVLHLPEDTAVDALALAVPRAMTDAQHATFDLLINRARGIE